MSTSWRFLMSPGSSGLRSALRTRTDIARRSQPGRRSSPRMPARLGDRVMLENIDVRPAIDPEAE